MSTRKETKIVAKIASKPKDEDNELYFTDLEPRECFRVRDNFSIYTKDILMRTDRGYVKLGNGVVVDQCDSMLSSVPVVRAIPRNPFEFDLEGE